MSKRYASLSLAILAGILFSSCLSSCLLAQPFEEVFGPDFSKDVGQRRVAPVTVCTGGGYIAIGTRSVGVGAASRVYLVRTNNAGGIIWEHFFDVGDDDLPDEGYSVVELADGSGFATTGTSQRSSSRWTAHYLRVSCAGRPQLSVLYEQTASLSPWRVVGHDIRQAAFGDGITTQPGDLLIAGYLEDHVLRSNPFIMRIGAAAGNLIWHKRYDAGANERFFGLTETSYAPAGAGDVVAVGEWRDDDNSEALVIRVDGNTGLLTGSSHCMATYGDIGEENFQSVVEVQTSPSDGLLVMAGMSSSAGELEDVYIVETKPDPCDWLRQVTIGNEKSAVYREYANDLIEVLEPTDTTLDVPIGSFAFTGLAETENSFADAFLLFVRAGSYQPIAGFLYGDHGAAEDFGVSLDQNGSFGPQPTGFVIAGTTFTDWDVSGDPIDLYLIQPDDAAGTSCEDKWNPKDVDWNWEHKERTPLPVDIFLEEEVQTEHERDETLVPVCR
jgi:hypothetical protein